MMRVSRRFWTAIVGVALTPAIALVSTLAPEHAHEAGADRPHAITHRHFGPHHVGAYDHHHDGVDQDDDTPEFDHDDGHVIWLNSVGAYHPTFRLPLPQSVPTERFELAVVHLGWIATPADAGAPDPGPPRLCQSLRGPPSPAV